MSLKDLAKTKAEELKQKYKEIKTEKLRKKQEQCAIAKRIFTLIEFEKLMKTELFQEKCSKCKSPIPECIKT